MSPAFSHCFLKRLSAFSKLSSGSTISFVTNTHPFPVQTMDSDLYHAPLDPRNQGRAGHARAGHWAGLGVPSPDHTDSQPAKPLVRATRKGLCASAERRRYGSWEGS